MVSIIDIIGTRPGVQSRSRKAKKPPAKDHSVSGWVSPLEKRNGKAAGGYVHATKGPKRVSAKRTAAAMAIGDPVSKMHVLRDPIAFGKSLKKLAKLDIERHEHKHRKR